MIEGHVRITVDGQEYDTDSLTYKEQRAIRRLIRNEVWDEDEDGPFDWTEVGEDEILPATIAVLMLRDTPGYTKEDARAALNRALDNNPRDVIGGDGKVPPTASEDSSDQTSQSEGSGSPT